VGETHEKSQDKKNQEFRPHTEPCRIAFGEKLSRNIAGKADFKLAFLMPDRKIAPLVYGI
jgi:hypothetical protein